VFLAMAGALYHSGYTGVVIGALRIQLSAASRTLLCMTRCTMSGCRLADILEERGMSRRELARRSGLNINTVCTWAHGDIAVIDLVKLAQVCAALQVQPGELLVWEPDQGPRSPRRPPSPSRLPHLTLRTFHTVEV
jgi:DNA-binding Xre family transcriptional regulator